MMKHVVVRLFLAAMIVGATAWAGAQTLPGAPGMGLSGHLLEKSAPSLDHALSMPGIQGRWWVNPRIAESLKLSDEQQKTMDSILIDHREKLIDLRAALQKTDLRMEQLVIADKLDEAAITAQIDRVAQARAELEKANAHYLLAIWGKLTPEQRTQVREFRAAQMGRFGWNNHLQMGPHKLPQGPVAPVAPVAPAAPDGR